jgi:hypothetical protein
MIIFMRNNEINAAITAIKSQYHILRRDIAKAIGLTPTHLSNICSSRYPMTNIYRDRLLEQYPLCTAQIERIAVDKVTPQSVQDAAESKSASMELQQLIAMTTDMAKDNRATVNKLVGQQENLIQQNNKLVDSLTQVTHVQKDMIQQNTGLMESVVAALNMQNEIMRRFADRVFGPDSSGQGKQDDAQQERKE